MKPDLIDSYINRLRRNLPIGSGKSERLVEEVEIHLREFTSCMQKSGYSKQDSQAKAIERFGDSKMIAQNMKTEFPVVALLWQVIRIGATLGIVLSSLMIALTAIMSFIYDQYGLSVQITSISIAALVFVNAILTWRVMWSDQVTGNAALLTILISGLILTGLGAASIVWAAHLGIMSGDWEYYGILRGMLISGQGIVSVIVAFPWRVVRKNMGQDEKSA